MVTIRVKVLQDSLVQSSILSYLLRRFGYERCKLFEGDRKHSLETNYEISKQRVGYKPRRDTLPSDYSALGFKCGLEIHQQLMTERKLFCRCPAGLYNDKTDYDAEVVRHMRPTLSELGEYDGTALMEFRTRKTIVYRLKNRTACTYEVDDTPPFKIDRQALEIALRIALMLKTNIVGELHITRKQYLDGSIPTGFQRTGIIGIEGEIPLSNRKVRIIQISLEEDSCREVSDIGHMRTYITDRLGMPLIETVTYPDMTTPDEAAEAGYYLRYLARSSGQVRSGIGAARQDVNVSITGGTRIEIKGVAHIAWIPELTHNEAFRQKALLEIAEQLNLNLDVARWKLIHKNVPPRLLSGFYSMMPDLPASHRLIAVNLPGFKNILSFFTQPRRVFADELSDRLKVIACLEKPNILVSEHCRDELVLSETDLDSLRELLKSRDNDAQVLIWGHEDDIPTAIETIDERCRMAFEGVPNETRKGLPDGTTIFERVLPGADRMYPDTDSAPIPIEDDLIEKLQQDLPPEICDRFEQLREWDVPEDTYEYLLSKNLVPVIERISGECGLTPRFVGCFLGHTLKRLEGCKPWTPGFSYSKIYGLARFVADLGLDNAILKEMLPVVYEHPNIVFDSVLTTIGYSKISREQILSHVPILRQKFNDVCTSKNPNACTDWIMGNLRKMALGNICLAELRAAIDKGVDGD